MYIGPKISYRDTRFAEARDRIRHFAVRVVFWNRGGNVNDERQDFKIKWAQTILGRIRHFVCPSRRLSHTDLQMPIGAIE